MRDKSKQEHNVYKSGHLTGSKGGIRKKHASIKLSVWIWKWFCF